MVGVVGVVGEVLDGTELAVGLVVLGGVEDLIVDDGVCRDVEGDDVDVPIVEKADAGRTLVKEFENPGFGKLVLDAGGPHCYVREAHVGIKPGGVAATEVGALEKDAAVG